MTGPEDQTVEIRTWAASGTASGTTTGTSPEGARIRERLARMIPTERLFRINSGVGWAGRLVKQMVNGVVLASARPLRAAPTGWPDLCGWTSVIVTPEMVGTTIAVFTAEEFKGPRDGLRPEQLAFKNCLERMGGVYRIIDHKGAPMPWWAHSEAVARAGLRDGDRLR
jgi:hypothetical protein